MKRISRSQVAEGNSNISGSTNMNNVSIKNIKRDTIIISFIVGFLSSILASYIYQLLFI